MDHREKIKQLMPALRKRFDGMSVRLQPKPNTSISDDVYEVHVRPQHAEKVTDLDWELKEAGPLDLIAKSNGVVFHDSKISSKSRNTDGSARVNVPSRPRRVRRG